MRLKSITNITKNEVLERKEKILGKSEYGVKGREGVWVRGDRVSQKGYKINHTK